MLFNPKTVSVCGNAKLSYYVSLTTLSVEMHGLTVMSPMTVSVCGSAQFDSHVSLQVCLSVRTLSLDIIVQRLSVGMFCSSVM